jgi:serine/threonine protein kinase
MGELDSIYIVGYFDSFIEGTQINIIIEFCQYGDLQGFINKQVKPLTENAIWKALI